VSVVANGVDKDDKKPALSQALGHSLASRFVLFSIKTTTYIEI
jgi:hypothetical protein